MLNLAVLLFAIAAVGGLILATLHFRGKDRPWALSILHALLAVAGFVTLYMGTRAAAPGHSGLAFLLLVIAALGGFILLGFHAQKKRLPSGVVIIHALVAVIGFLVLVSAVFMGK